MPPMKAEDPYRARMLARHLHFRECETLPMEDTADLIVPIL